MAFRRNALQCHVKLQLKINALRQGHSRFALRTDLVSSRPVQGLASPHKLTDSSPLPGTHFRARVVLSVLFLAALWFGLCRELSGEWSVNEQYNFGWFVPFFALYLLWLRWQDAPPAQVPNLKSPAEPWERRDRRRSREGSGERARAASEFQIANSAALAIAIAALLVLLPVRLFEIANPEWRLLAWVHAATVVVLTLLLI